MATSTLQELIWIYCPGRGGVRRNKRADSLDSKAQIAETLKMSRTYVYTSGNKGLLEEVWNCHWGKLRDCDCWYRVLSIDRVARNAKGNGFYLYPINTQRKQRSEPSISAGRDWALMSLSRKPQSWFLIAITIKITLGIQNIHNVCLWISPLSSTEVDV